MLEPRDHVFRTPRGGFSLGFFLAFETLGNLEQSVGAIFAAIEDYILDTLAQFRLEFVIHRQHPGIDDAHVQASLNRVIEKDCVHRLAHVVVATERKRNVRDATRNERTLKILFDPARCLNESSSVIVVFFNAGGHRQNVRIENNVRRIPTQFFDQNPVRPRANLDATLERIGLTVFIEGHHHGCRTVPLQGSSLTAEFFLAAFEGN